MKILISGAAGHMGREVAAQAGPAGIEIAGGVDVAGVQADFPVWADFTQAPEVDCIVDFSRPASLDGLLAYAVQNRIPAVLATTGYDEVQLAAIDEAAKVIPVFRSANMSVGIALLRALSRKAAQVLGDDFDVEIVEAHHNRKADAPSGTALMLADAINDAAGGKYEYVYDRTQHRQKRGDAELGISAVRGGGIVGEHEVLFCGPEEVVRLSHSAGSRGVFADGAIQAALYLQGREPGYYNMNDLIKEKLSCE